VTAKVTQEAAIAELMNLLLEGADHRAAAVSSSQMNWEQRKFEYAQWVGFCAQKLEELFESAGQQSELKVFFGDAMEAKLPYWHFEPGAARELTRLYEERINVLMRLQGNLK